MTFKATAIEVMLASPGDVKDERVMARKVIAQWNAENARETGAVLLTMGWESHAGSDVSGSRAQALINERLVVHADLMIGIFWTRLGSPTGVENSGTVEEIKLHHSAHKPLMLFFSDAPINPSKIDMAQYEEVTRFRHWAYEQGYVSSYSQANEFADVFRRDLTLMLKDNARMRALVLNGQTAAQPEPPEFSANASRLLFMIGGSVKGQLTVQLKDGGLRLAAGADSIIESRDTIEMLKWRGALDELLSQSLIVDKTGRRQLYELTPKASGLLPPQIKTM